MIAVKANHDRLQVTIPTAGLTPDEVNDLFHEIFENPASAYQKALSQAGEGDRIVTFGSFYTVAGVMAYRNNQAH